MSVLGAADGHTVWIVALGIGAVVALVVSVLMALLLSYLKDIEASAVRLLALGGHVEANTANVGQLAATAPALEELLEEAEIHRAHLSAQQKR